MAYSDKVLEHYNNPRNVGSFAKDDPGVGTGVVGAPECGDVMKLQLRISDNGVIEDARFKTFGCGSAIASSSYVTELVKGKHIDEAMSDYNPDSELCRLSDTAPAARPTSFFFSEKMFALICMVDRSPFLVCRTKQIRCFRT